MRRLSWLVALMLLGCSQPGPEPPATTRQEAPPRPHLVQQIRAAAAASDGQIDVQPLRDPAVEDLRHAAERSELEGRYEEAHEALGRALQISPGDPELLQWQAEIALLRSAFDEAETLARDSYQRGPRLGSLCVRNWTLVRVVREQQGDAEGARTAAQNNAHCQIEPPVRM